MQRSPGAKYWELVADDLSANGWSYGYCSLIDRSGRTSWKVDAHRDDGKRYVVTADELLTAFLEIQEQLRIVS